MRLRTFCTIGMISLTAGCASFPSPFPRRAPAAAGFTPQQRAVLAGVQYDQRYASMLDDGSALLRFEQRPIGIDERKRMTRAAVSLMTQQAVADCGAFLQSGVNGRNIWGTVLRSTATVAGVLGGAVTPKGTKGAFSALAGGASGISSDIQKDLVGSTALELLKSVGDEQARTQAAVIDGRLASGYYHLNGVGAALRDVQVIRTQCTPANVLSVIRGRAAPATPVK